MALESGIIPVIDIGVIVIIAMVFGIIAARLRLSSAIGYILAGMALGPLWLKLLVPGEGITPVFAEFGVLLIMFYLGLELNIRKFKQTGAVSFVLAIAQMSLVFVGGFLLSKLLGFADLEAVVLGAMIVCSSTVMVAKFIIEKGILAQVDSRIALSILILQDIFAIFMLVIISSFSAQRSLNTLVLTAVFFMIAVFVVLSKLSRFLLDYLHSLGQDNKMVYYAIGVGVLFAAAADSLGLSAVIGAVFAGLAMAETKYGERIKEELGLFREFFVLFFFVAFGTTVFYDPAFGGVILPSLAGFLPLLAISLAFVLVFLACSFIAFTIAGLALGMDKYTVAKIASLLAPLGEFVIIIAAAGQPLFSAAAYTTVTTIAFLAILITAPLSPVVYANSRRIMDAFLSIMPAGTARVLNAIGSNFRAAEEITENPAFKNELFDHLKSAAVNAVIMLAIVYISVLLKEQFTSADVSVIPGVTLSAFLLIFITWPAYRLFNDLRRIVSGSFEGITRSFFPPEIGREVKAHAVNTVTGFLFTAAGIAAIAWTYYSGIDFVYLVVPGVYTAISFTFFARSVSALAEGFDSLEKRLNGPSLRFTREFESHSRKMSLLNAKRMEAREKAEEALDGGDLKRARRILYDYRRFEHNELSGFGAAERPARKSLEKYFLNKPKKRRAAGKNKTKKSRGKNN